LGDGTSHNQRTTPVQVKNPAGSAALTGVVSVTAGCFPPRPPLPRNTTASWGDNNPHPTGQGGGGRGALPRQVLNGLGNAALPAVIGVSAGLYDTCAVISDHTARCWGTNTFGNLGLGSTTGKNAARPLPAPVRNGNNTANLASVSAISAGPESTC